MNLALCPECGTEMNRFTVIDEYDGVEKVVSDYYECPKCKYWKDAFRNEAESL